MANCREVILVDAEVASMRAACGRLQVARHEGRRLSDPSDRIDEEWAQIEP